MKRAPTVGIMLMVVAFGGARTARAQHGHEQDQHQAPARVPQEEQQHRVQQQQQRSNENRQHLEQQVPAVQQQAAQLQAQKRMAQYRAQQDYVARLQQQQQHSREEHDYSRDAYITTPHTYRYVISGSARETNQYGVDVLREAVNYGYQQGYIAGRADREDHWAPNYENSIAYRDANYGYGGSFIDRADYNYYFREGFRRGYDDGYYSRSRYGSSLNGTPTILGPLLSNILGLQPIR